ncbi:Major facilitator superfamily protein [Rhynchospora pubera]|uniref:Major facilitator superfamily protein n=1 Tax=Rhynchospora pubera TaxID=906938 RepID=A0AAV8FHX7_9POAL|nr:Major facilitator superfamily protein [Rhynchospora pubera]
MRGLRRTRWAATAASAWVQCAAGGSYCFGVYSEALKASQGFDQSSLDHVAFFKDLGANVGLLSGLLASWAPLGLRRPWLVLLAGAAQSLAGYLPIWLAVTGAIRQPPAMLICLCMLVAAHAQTFYNTADVVTAVENFPDRRGTVIGIMKGFLGLSGAILVQLYHTFFDGKPSCFILMLAALPSSLSLILMYFVEVCPKTDRGAYDKKFLDAFSLIALCLAGYLMLVIIGQSFYIKIPSTIQFAIFVVLMVLLGSLFSIVMKADAESKALDEIISDERVALVGDKKNDGETATSGSGSELVPSGENLNLLQAMGKIDFWLLFFAMSCGMGSGLATVNNISQIGSSLGYAASKTSTLVSLWSIWNFLGRFSAGYVSDYFLRKNCISRPFFIAITLVFMSIGHLTIASGITGSLYIGSILVGMCYGAQWSLMPSITSEIFGLTHFGTIFNTVAIASPTGSYILSVRVVGYVYDMESVDGHACMGKHCFALSFGIMSAVCFIGSAVAFWLSFRSRKFYRQVIYARLQND